MSQIKEENVICTEDDKTKCDNRQNKQENTQLVNIKTQKITIKSVIKQALEVIYESQLLILIIGLLLFFKTMVIYKLVIFPNKPIDWQYSSKVILFISASVKLLKSIISSILFKNSFGKLS